MFNKKQKLIFLSVVVVVVMLVCTWFVTPVLAQGVKTGVPNPLGDHDFASLVGRAISVILSAFGAIALLMFIIGGLMWMTSMGDPARVKKGRDTLIWASLGIVVAFSSYAIIRFVLSVIGVA